MKPERIAIDADERHVRGAIAALASRGCFSSSATPEAMTKILDDVAYDFPGFARTSDLMVPVLREQGWTDVEIGLIVSGVDMALMIVHEVINPEK